MTLVIGLEDPANHRAILCADSGAWRGDQIDILRTPKIWRSNGWIAGLSGTWAQSLRARDVALPELENPSREECEEALVAWSDRLLERLGKLSDATERNGWEKRYEYALLVARAQWVWYVSGGTVTNVERGYQAIGCEDYAIGALAMLTQLGWKDAIDMACVTMGTVRRITTAIHPPFVWMDTLGEGGTWE